MIIEPLVMLDYKKLEEGYEYKSINWAHVDGFKKDGWEEFGPTKWMQFLVVRRKIVNK